MVDLILYGLSESSGVQEDSDDVVVQVGEAEGDAAQVFEPAIDGLGGPVAGVVVVEVGQDVAQAAFEGACQGHELGALGLGAADVFLETERKVSRMFSLEERSRAVELYLTTPMTTAQVVECLGYPTRQCLERWLAMDPRYAGRMAKPIIPLETRRKAIELVLGGMQQKQAAKQLGVSVGAVHNWVRAYRRGGMAALQPRNQNAAQSGKSASVRPRGGADAGGGDDVEALRRRVEELELENALMREVVEVVKKRPRRRPAAPVEQGEDDAGRPAEAEVFAEVDGLLAAHSAEQLPLPPCQDRRRQVRRAARPRGAGVRRLQGQVRVPSRQGRARDGRLGERGPQAHGRGRALGACSQTAALQLLRGGDHARSR